MSVRLVVAAAVAFTVGYFAGPAAGFQTFALVYGATGFLDPNKKVLGSRLQDLKAPQASYGSPIPYVEGAPRLAGIFVYASDKREIATTETQGKGGPGVDATTFTYEVDALIMLACNQCQGIRRIWSNGKLVWSQAETSDAETLAASAQAVSWRELRFYSGADDQLPDPTYEAAVGVGNAPAYRGRTTVMLEGLNLGNSGQLPVLTFEVVSEADATARTFPFSDVPSLVAPIGQGASPFTASGFDVHIGQWDNGYGNSDVNVYRIDSAGAASLLGSYAHPLNQPSGHGQTDVAGMMSSYLRDIYWVEWNENLFAPTVFRYRLPIGEDFGGGQLRFCMRGDVLIVGSAAFGSKKLYRFSKADGVGAGGAVPLAESAVRAEYVCGLAADGTSVYASAINTTSDIEVLDVATLGHLSDIAVPPGTTTAQGVGVLVDEVGVLLAIVDSPGPGNIWERQAGSWVNAYPDIAATYSFTNAQLGVGEGVVFIMTAQSAPAATQRVHAYYKTIQQSQVPLDQVVFRLCLRTKQLEAADIDVTALAGQYVRAMAISQVGPTRSTLEMLAGVFLFEWVEGEKLKAVLRGGAPVATIPYADLGVSDDGTAEPLPKKRANDIEIPAQVTVKFANVLNDFQDGAETGDRLVTESTAISVIEIPIGMTPAEAKRCADANTLDLAVSELQIGPISLSRKYAHLEPTDVVIVTARDGSTFRTRIVKGTAGGGVNTFELVLDDATVIQSEVATDEEYASSNLIRTIADTGLELLDIPILRDADNASGLYVAGKAAGNGRFAGFELDKSLDGTSYAKVLDSSAKAVMGTASTTLGAFGGGNVFDEVNLLTVDVGAGQLSSSTRELLLASDANALLVGAEVVQFRTASLLGPGVYVLSGFRRGLRGTEWAMASHAAAERVALLSVDTLRRAPDQTADIGIPYHWKAVSFGKSRATAPEQVVADTGVALKPFAPADLRLDRSNSAAVLTWHRRSRLSSRLFQSPPLGEVAELYDVELRDAGDTVVQTATVATPSYEISSLVGGDYILPPIWGMRTISGDRIAVRDDLPYLTTYPKSLVKLASDGSIAQQSPDLGEEVYQWCNDGDSIYAAVARIVGGTYVNSRVVKLTRGTLTTIDATNTATTGGDYWGVAHDGTNVWVSERLTGNLRKLNATTLASVAAYAFAGGPTALQHVAGKLWVLCSVSNELVKWDIATQTEDLRIALGGAPYDLLVVGTRVFVACATATQVRDASTGTLVTSHAYGANFTLPQRVLVPFGSQVLLAGYSSGAGTRLLLLDAATGAQEDIFPQPTVNFYFPAGSVGADLYLTGSDGPGFSLRTRKYTVAPPGLAGYSATVWQRSATVGRGYPATLEL